jgi:hypothetical protein
VSDVLKCDSEEPLSTGFGAYISTCPVAGSRPAVRMPLCETTAAPTQWRSPVSIAEVARCASDIADQSSPLLWSSRLRMKTSSWLLSREPVVGSTNVRKPSPCPSSCNTTDTKSIFPDGVLPSRP